MLFTSLHLNLNVSRNSEKDMTFTHIKCFLCLLNYRTAQKHRSHTVFTILDECFSHHTSSRPCFEWLASLSLHVHGYIFHQVERQKLKSEEGTMRLSAEKSRLDRSLNTAEQELQEAQQQILMLQVGNGR